MSYVNMVESSQNCIQIYEVLIFKWFLQTFRLPSTQFIDLNLNTYQASTTFNFLLPRLFSVFNQSIRLSNPICTAQAVFAHFVK